MIQPRMSDASNIEVRPHHIYNVGKSPWSSFGGSESLYIKISQENEHLRRDCMVHIPKADKRHHLINFLNFGLRKMIASY